MAKRVKLFNLDLHISVIADITDILKRLYGNQIEITNWSISGHSWVFGKQKAKVDIINEHTWHSIDQHFVDMFYLRYQNELSKYDGFIVTHTPVFCRLFEKFQKPIIMINSCRYDQPYCFNKNIRELNELHACLHRLVNRGLLVAISNNRADQAYLMLGAGITSAYIPSLCLYTDVKYIWSHAVNQPITISCDAPRVMNKLKAIRGLEQKPKSPYEWSNLMNRRALVHIPYEISTMSIFEQYSAGTPLIFPTKRFFREMVMNRSIDLNSLYWLKVGYIPEALQVLNNIDWWIERSDFYDMENMPGITYFDSWEELQLIVNNFTWSHEDSDLHLKRIEERTEKYLHSWDTIVKIIWPDLESSL